MNKDQLYLFIIHTCTGAMNKFWIFETSKEKALERIPAKDRDNVVGVSMYKAEPGIVRIASERTWQGFAWFCAGCSEELGDFPRDCKKCGYTTAFYKTECYRPRKG